MLVNKKVMNNRIRFKMKMLIVLTFCVFMTFYMLMYVLKLTKKCEKDTCYRVSKSPSLKSSYFFYNITELSSQILKPSGSFLSTLDYKMRTARSTLGNMKVSMSVFNVPLGSDVARRKHVPLQYSVSYVGRSTVGMQSDAGLDNTVWYDPVYRSRRRNMQKFCRKYFDPYEMLKLKEIKLNHILIDKKHKVLYCYVPKVACTNWKRIFLVLTGKAQNISQVINLPSSEIHAKNLFKSLQNYTVPEVLKITEGYTKFIFVRHPFERLLSAYRNKLEQHYNSSKYFQARFGKYIIKNFRKNPSNTSLERGDDVTFAEFVNYLISSEPSLYNEHWQRVTDLCHPCLLDYDFIGKYETLIQDSNYLLKYLGLNVSFPILSKPSTTASNLKKYYNTLGKSAIYKLYNIYQMDFRLFGYDLFNTSDWSNDW